MFDAVVVSKRVSSSVLYPCSLTGRVMCVLRGGFDGATAWEQSRWLSEHELLWEGPFGLLPKASVSLWENAVTCAFGQPGG